MINVKSTANYLPETLIPFTAQLSQQNLLLAFMKMFTARCHFLALLLALLVSPLTAQAQSNCYPFSETIPGGHSGSMSLSMNSCVSGTDSTMTGTLTFSNFAETAGESMNGSFSMTSSTSMSNNYVSTYIDGGPLRYIGSGESTEMYYEQLKYIMTFDPSNPYNVSFTNVSGGIRFNGEYFAGTSFLNNGMSFDPQDIETIKKLSSGATGNSTPNTNSVPVSSATEIFSNPQTATVENGVVRIKTAPTAPLQLATGAVQNAAVVLDTADPVPVLVGTSTINYTRESAGTTLQVRSIAGNAALAPVSGSITIHAPSTGSFIPVTGSSSGSAYVQTSAADTRVSAGPDEKRNLVFAVSSGGKVTYQSISGSRAIPSSFDLYPGEAVLADDAGAAGQVRLGSRTQNQSQAGDFLATLPTAAQKLKVPRVSGTSQRFGKDWSTLVGQAIASKLDLGSFTSLTQDSSGVLTLVTSRGTYRFVPVGSLALADKALGNGARAISIAAIAANLTEILDSSLSFAVAPATAYSDLETALKNISSSATMEILGDGVILARLAGTDYIAQPAPQTTTGSSINCPGFVTENNQLALCDASGKRQVLNAAFADADTLRDTFRTALALPTLSVTNTGSNGSYAANVSGANYTLSPDITLTTPPSSQAGKLWWSDASSGKFFIRYPSGQAQGFGLR